MLNAETNACLIDLRRTKRSWNAMTDPSVYTESPMDSIHLGSDLVSTVHVCTSCREPGTPRSPKELRAGFRLFQRLKHAFESSPIGDSVEVLPAECLSVCPRPCGIALSSGETWTYLFGDQDPQLSTSDIVNCVALYLQSPDGFMRRSERPHSLRESILGRVPPRRGVC